ncbi:MAG: nucleoside triphosphate pyrophosphohydrolase [Candidatus Kerfeldbacteria bacterium]|nr:nucleoside triphosphate pyrophosphohydrolase [Candidatus Kerfeldbacteria bacterium]
MKKIYYHKLIRDRVPLVMKKNGAAFRVKRLDLKSYQRELLKKVGEEASSLPRLRSKREMASELADTIDVINAIKRTFKISERQIKSEQRKAFVRKGGFKKRLFLFWAEDTGYRTNERRYKK